MSGRLSGKTAVVSAAAQGIGRASALAFAAEGAQVLATDIRGDLFSPLERVANVRTRLLDVTDSGAISSLAAEIEAPDILFNCAGYVHHGTVLDCTEEDWSLTMELNVRSMYRMIRNFLPGMIARGGGSIVNVASVASSLRGFPFRFAYGTSKAAVIGLTKSVAADYVRDGVRCNCICPGTVQTPSLDQRIAAFEDPVQARKDFVARQPLGRLGTAEEIAAMAVYLASDESGYTTGTAMVVDGGITA